MDLPMMSAAQRNGELIAHLTAESSALCKSQMVCVRWLSAANQARVPRDKLDMIAVANSARLGQGQLAFVD
jgi:hypothetical protein